VLAALSDQAIAEKIGHGRYGAQRITSHIMSNGRGQRDTAAAIDIVVFRADTLGVCVRQWSQDTFVCSERSIDK